MEFLNQNSCKFLVMLVLQSPDLAFGCADRSIFSHSAEVLKAVAKRRAGTGSPTNSCVFFEK